MIVSKKMKDAVDQELVESMRWCDTGIVGFPVAGIHGNHDIAQKLRMNLRMIPFPHGKRDYIGRSSVVQVFLVELGDAVIIDKQYRQFTFRAVQGV